MPKKPTTSIEGFRIELQDKERQILQEAVTAYSVLSYAQAFDRITSFENLYLIVTLIEMVTGKEILAGTPNDVGTIIDTIRENVTKESFLGDEFGIGSFGVPALLGRLAGLIERSLGGE